MLVAEPPRPTFAGPALQEGAWGQDAIEPQAPEDSLVAEEAEVVPSQQCSVASPGEFGLETTTQAGANGNVLGLCWRWRSGEALWEATEASLLNSSPASGGNGSLIIFDWDDTLFPTTALSTAGRLLEPRDGADGADLLPCAFAACQAIRTAKRYGRVVVVTNAMKGWVQEMISRFMPLLEPELHDVTVISARSIYEPQGLVEPSTWKPLCFQRVVRCLYTDPSTGACNMRNLVSIGDSWYERAAVFQVPQDLGIPCHVKSLKFLGMPNIEDVARQLQVCAHHFEWLMCYDGVLDLWVAPCGTVQAVTMEVLNGTVQTTGSLFVGVQPAAGSETGALSVDHMATDTAAPVDDNEAHSTSAADGGEDVAAESTVDGCAPAAATDVDERGVQPDAEPLEFVDAQLGNLQGAACRSFCDAQQELLHVPLPGYTIS
mmetsp:Transcript_30148/g.82863  ORF Transcript_30148/g.82863 Transcript_30148/m.82863 type:complete len:432 (+) Transcript_30148:80-1375(+)